MRGDLYAFSSTWQPGTPDLKKIAIEVGRRQMGQQGRGKGRKVEQIAFFEEEENSADDPFSDEDEAHLDLFCGLISK